MRRTHLTAFLALAIACSAEDPPPTQSLETSNEAVGTDAPAPAPPPSEEEVRQCNLDHQVVDERLWRLRAEYAGTCVRDEDCTRVYAELPCHSACGEGAVATALLPQFEDALRTYGSEVCPTLSQVCLPLWTCLPMMHRAACVESRCKLVRGIGP